VQKILSMISSGIYRCYVNRESQDIMLIPFPLLTRVLSVLVNSSTTELDCTVFDSAYSRNLNNFLLEHALLHCPKISKIKMMNSHTLDAPLGRRNEVILPVEFFKSRWSNLRGINSSHWYLCTEFNLWFIRENFPDIESVNLYC